MDVECTLWGVWASTMTLHRHHSDSGSGLRSTPKSRKSTPYLHRHILWGWTHIPIHSISRCLNTLYTYHMDVDCTPQGVWASTMALHHHLGSGLPQNLIISTPHLNRHTSVRVDPYPFIAYQGAKTLSIHISYGCGMHSLWGFEPQPWHYIVVIQTQVSGLRSTPKSWKSTPYLHRHTLWGWTHMPIHSISRCLNTLYISYGCGLHSTGGLSINHGTTSSLRLRSNYPKILKIHPRPALV